MRSLLLALLIAVATPVWAKWVRVGESNKFFLYQDSATIRKNGDFRTIWVLHDLKEKDSDGEKSITLKHEYDCRGGRFRLLASGYYSGKMAKGKILSRSDTPNAEWINIPRRSGHWGTFKFVCVK